MWRGLGWRPSLPVSLPALRDMGRLASRIVLGNSLRFIADKVDSLIVGLVLSGSGLGFYYLVIRLLGMLEDVLLGSLDAVMLPVLSRLQDDLPRLRAYYLELVWVTMVAWLPAVLGLGAVADQALPLLFGEQWAGAGTAMLCASTVGFTAAFQRATTALAVARGRVGVYVRVNSLKLLVAAVVMTIAAQFGVNGAAVGYGLVSILMLPVHVGIVCELTGLKARDLAWRFLPIVAAGLAMLVVVLPLGALHATPGVLAARILSGALVYTAVLCVLSQEAAARLSSALRLVPGLIGRMRGLLAVATVSARRH
jgi:teichuronic acid exporter